MSLRLAFLTLPVAVFFSLTACTTTSSQAVTPTVTPLPDHSRPTAQADTTFEKDRRAILAMIGEYEVTFTFRETVVLKPDYERKTSKDTGAFETVVLVEDSGRKIVLQHLLVSKDGAHVIKHWRQDWTFEAPTRFEFLAVDRNACIRQDIKKGDRVLEGSSRQVIVVDGALLDQLGIAGRQV